MTKRSPLQVQVDLGTSGLSQNRGLKELILVFLRLGMISFGGPAAHIAMMEDEFVRRLQWLTRRQFLDYLGSFR